MRQLRSLSTLTGVPSGIRPAVLWQIVGWFGLWLFWFVVSRHNHPTLVLDAIATAVLVSAVALAVYANHFWLRPRLWRAKRFTEYALAMLVALGVLALGCVLLIQQVYDLLWGPDPRRFGFWANLGLDFSGLAIHVLAITACTWIFRRVTGRRDPSEIAVG